jgi:hypothetical protein
VLDPDASCTARALGIDCFLLYWRRRERNPIPVGEFNQAAMEENLREASQIDYLLRGIPIINRDVKRSTLSHRTWRFLDLIRMLV